MQNRKANRLKEYDYSQPGDYFVTICVNNFRSVFGFINNDVMCLNIYGSIIYQQLSWLETQYPYVTIDTAIVMPNHIHVIISISDDDPVVTGRDLSLQKDKIKPLSELIGAFKTTASKSIHLAGLTDFRWQRSFYDSIINNDIALNNARDYIINNPIMWNRDRNNQSISNG